MSRISFIIGCAAAMLCGHASNKAGAQEYSVTGAISFKHYDMTGKDVQDVTANFDVAVASNAWTITIKPSGGQDDYSRISFDGTNMYVFYDLEHRVAKERASGAAVADNLALGNVLIKDVPRDPFSEGIGQLWLAFASSSYFRSLQSTNLLEAPYFQTPAEPNVIAATVKRLAFWDITNHSTGLPRMVCYLANDARTTNAYYSASSFGKLGDLEVPTDSVFDVYYDFAAAELPQKRVLQARYVIKVEKFGRLMGKLLFPPEVPVLTRVYDNRFENDPKKPSILSYNADKRFLERVEIRQLPKAQKEEYPPPPPGSSIHHTNSDLMPRSAEAKNVAFALIFSNLIFLSVYITRLLRGKARTKNK